MGKAFQAEGTASVVDVRLGLFGEQASESNGMWSEVRLGPPGMPEDGYLAFTPRALLL